MAYKKDQGRTARLTAFWSLAILVFYGATSLRTELVSQAESLAKPLGGIRIPVLGIDLSPAFLAAAVVFGIGMFFLVRWLERPRQADLLIETESELKKVTWPSLEETINGSVVVILCVVFIMVYLAGADWLLGRWAKIILIGS